MVIYREGTHEREQEMSDCKAVREVATDAQVDLHSEPWHFLRTATAGGLEHARALRFRTGQRLCGAVSQLTALAHHSLAQREDRQAVRDGVQVWRGGAGRIAHGHLGEALQVVRRLHVTQAGREVRNCVACHAAASCMPHASTREHTAQVKNRPLLPTRSRRPTSMVLVVGSS